MAQRVLSACQAGGRATSRLAKVGFLLSSFQIFYCPLRLSFLEIQCNPITPPPDGYAWTSSDGRREKYTSDSESVAFQTLYFECGGQLELIGQSSITCLENGSWSGTVPICSGKASVLRYS